jgi:long-subunit fatty acid transport protein
MVSAQKAEEDKQERKEVYAGYSGSLYNPIGFKIGVLNFFDKTGLYLNFQARSMRFDLDYSFNIQNVETFLGNDRCYVQTGESKIESHMINLGLTHKLADNFGLYGGLGYGKYLKTLEVDYLKLNNTKDATYWAKDDDSCSGISFELGANYQFNDMLFSVGMSSIEFDRYDLQFSIAYLF